jgi:hypothetical protein
MKTNIVLIVFDIVGGEPIVSAVFSDPKKASAYAKTLKYHPSPCDSKMKINNSYIEEHELID